MKYFKYPRTYHLPWSEAITSDDKVHEDISFFNNKKIVITLKMDGENTTIYNNKVYARSIDSNDHESRHWIKNFATNFQWQLQPTFRVCGENLYAKHSILYNNLSSYFLVFNIWNEDLCFAWDFTKEICHQLNVNTVPVIYTGIMPSQKEIEDIFHQYKKNHEGYVIRLYDEFYYKDFSLSTAKYVRKNHVKTDKHWMSSKIVRNKLR